MPTLYTSAYQATSGSFATATIDKKPSGEKVVIRRITLVGRVGDLLFAKTHGWLYSKSNTYQRNGLFAKLVVASTLYGSPEVFRGSVEWPENFSVVLKAKVQVALETIYWAVEYDIVEEPEKRKRWGE